MLYEDLKIEVIEINTIQNKWKTKYSKTGNT
ncbi:MAG: hypothetical protein ACI9RM_002861 [Ulvibacter sp.]|jgi:hypothetical protein